MKRSPISDGDRSAALLAWSNEGIFALDAQGVVVYANPQAGALLDQQPQALVGQHWTRVFPETAVPPLTAVITQTPASPQPVPVELFVASTNRWLSARLVPLPEETLLYLNDITQRKAAEAALTESQEKFRDVFEVSNVGKSITSPSGEIFVNQAFADMLGYTRQEMTAKKWQDVTPAEDIAEIEALLGPLQTGVRDAVRLNKRYLHKDGSIVWGDVSAAVRRDETGKLLHFITTVVDITERRQAREALAHSHDLLRYIIEHDHNAIAVHDRDLRYIYVSQRYLEDYRIADENVIGKHHYEVFPEIPERFREVHRRALTGEVLRSERDFLKRQDGTIDWARWECRPWYQQDGLIGGIILYTEVITDRVLAEEALRESEARYRQLVDAAPLSVFVHQEGKIAFINPAGARLLGAASPTELIGKSVVDIIHPDWLPAAQARIRRTLAGESGLYPVQLRHVRVDGTSFPVEVTAVLLSYRGKPAVQVIVTDITARKQAEAALRQSHAQLRQLTSRLAEVEERERRALSRELHDRVGQTLTALNINLNIMQGQLSPDSAEKVGRRIVDSIELVKETVTRVRDVMADLHPPVLADYGLTAALRWYAGQFSQRTEIPVHVQAGEETAVRFSPHLEAVLFRVAQEALTNIARHAAPQAVQITIEMEAEHVRLTIRDDGKGFDLQSVASTRHSHWGLRTMRERLEGVGGAFSLQTAPGGGTKIIAELSDPTLLAHVAPDEELT